MVIHHRDEPFTWEGVPILPYKETGTHFRAITRHTLFTGDEELPVEFRYFEIEPGGHSTLERHEHAHAVMVIRGCGHVLVGSSVSAIGLFDLVHVPSMTWHQFRAGSGEPLGFLCVVSALRDRPQRPTDDDLASLRSVASVAEFIQV